MAQYISGKSSDYKSCLANKKKEKKIYIYITFESHKSTSAIADVMMSGIGSVVSPMPSLINLACGHF
jgi:uncharacterized protein YbaA (DUF1428 family)